MKKIMMIVAFLGVFILHVGLPSAFAAPAEHFRTGWQPVNFDSYCCPGGDQWVTVSGMESLQFNFIQDGAGGLHGEGSYTVRGTAVGYPSGAGYVYASYGETGPFNYREGGPENYTFQVHFLLISLDPTLPDLRMRGSFHYTVDANGNPTAYIDSFEIICSG